MYNAEGFAAVAAAKAVAATALSRRVGLAAAGGLRTGRMKKISYVGIYKSSETGYGLQKNLKSYLLLARVIKRICWRNADWRCLTRSFGVGWNISDDYYLAADLPKASSRATLYVASRREVPENRRLNGLPVAGRRCCLGPGPRCAGPVQAETSMQL